MFIFEKKQSFPDYDNAFEALQKGDDEENSIIVKYQSAFGPNFDNYLYDQKDSIKIPLCHIKCAELDVLEHLSKTHKKNKMLLKKFNYFLEKLKETKIHKDSYDAAITEEKETRDAYETAKDFAENVHQRGDATACLSADNAMRRTKILNQKAKINLMQECKSWDQYYERNKQEFSIEFVNQMHEYIKNKREQTEYFIDCGQNIAQVAKDFKNFEDEYLFELKGVQQDLDNYNLNA